MPLDRRVGNYFDNSASFLRRVARWTGPISYATGGEDVSGAIFGMGKVVVILLGTATDGTGVRDVVWNPATEKLLWFTAAGTEVTAATDLSTFTASIEVIGH